MIFGQNRHFQFLSLARKGVRLVRNLLLTWSPSIRSKTPWQTKKSNGTSPRSCKYFYTSQDVDISILPVPEKHAIQEIYRVSSLNKFIILWNHLLFWIISCFCIFLVLFIHFLVFVDRLFWFLLLDFARYWLMKGIVDLTIWNLNPDLQLMAGQKIFATPRGGPVRLFGLPRGFTPNQWGSRQKKISDQAHPLHWKNRTSKSQKIDFFDKNTHSQVPNVRCPRSTFVKSDTVAVENKSSNFAVSDVSISLILSKEVFCFVCGQAIKNLTTWQLISSYCQSLKKQISWPQLLQTLFFPIADIFHNQLSASAMLLFG